MLVKVATGGMTFLLTLDSCWIIHPDAMYTNVNILHEHCDVPELYDLSIECIAYVTVWRGESFNVTNQFVIHTDYMYTCTHEIFQKHIPYWLTTWASFTNMI